MKQVSGLLSRLNRQDSLGQLTKLRITQGCQRAGLTEDVWKLEEISANKVWWKNNLACLTIIKARDLGINIRTESNLWRTFGYGTKIRELVETQLWKRSGVEINEAGIIYLNQLLDVKGEKLITWQQFKNFCGQSSRGKKAEWFKEIESKVLEEPTDRRIKGHLKTNRHNTQAMKTVWGAMSKDKRRKEWIIYGTQENRQLGKIIKKKKKKVLLEHWQMQSKENEIATEISRCNGCTKEEGQQDDNCWQWIRTSNKIKVVPDTSIEKRNSKIKIAMDQLIEKAETESLKNNEQKLEGLMMLEGLEIEIIKRQKLNENVKQEILKTLRRNLSRNKNKYIIYTDSATNMKTKEGT
jgi:hypothetical protein